VGRRLFLWRERLGGRRVLEARVPGAVSAVRVVVLLPRDWGRGSHFGRHVGSLSTQPKAVPTGRLPDAHRRAKNGTRRGLGREQRGETRDDTPGAE